MPEVVHVPQACAESGRLGILLGVDALGTQADLGQTRSGDLLVLHEASVSVPERVLGKREQNLGVRQHGQQVAALADDLAAPGVAANALEEPLEAATRTGANHLEDLLCVVGILDQARQRAARRERPNALLPASLQRLEWAALASGIGHVGSIVRVPGGVKRRTPIVLVASPVKQVVEKWCFSCASCSALALSSDLPS